MLDLDTRTTRMALLAGVAVYAVLLVSVAVWILLKGGHAAHEHALRSPSVTVSLNKKAADVPASWTGDNTPAPTANAPTEKQAEKQAEAQQTEQTAKTENVAPVASATAAAETTAPVVNAASVPSSSARPKWMRFARPFDAADTRPRIGIIINDLGFVESTTKSATAMPGGVTLAFSSVAPDIDGKIVDARAGGHEILLTIPMEPENYPQNDPGPNALLTALSDADNITRLRRALALADSYVAIMPSMGERFVLAENKLIPVLDVVKQEGLMIVDNTVNKNSLVAPLARLGKVPFARVDMVIDPSITRQPMQDYFTKLEELAKTRGQAMAMVLPYPAAMDALKTWTESLEKKGFVLAPVTALASEEIEKGPEEAQAATPATPTQEAPPAADAATETAAQPPTSVAPAAAPAATEKPAETPVSTPASSESLTPAVQTP
jgi:polysaccharide deacetylase 2 family uncharacterized protein YibQ